MLVQKLRLQRGWSQEQLATVSGLSVRTIQRIERGQSASSKRSNIRLQDRRVATDRGKGNGHAKHCCQRKRSRGSHRIRTRAKDQEILSARGAICRGHRHAGRDQSRHQPSLVPGHLAGTRLGRCPGSERADHLRPRPLPQCRMGKEEGRRTFRPRTLIRLTACSKIAVGALANRVDWMDCHAPASRQGCG